MTAAGAVAAVVWGRTREKKLELLQSHRAEMRPVYEELLTAFSTTTPDAGFMQEFQRKILVLGATSVLQAWLAFVRAQPPDGEPANLAFMLLWEQVLFAIRADLGHDNTGLAPGDLLRVYVNDADTFFRESKTDFTPPSS